MKNEHNAIIAWAMWILAASFFFGHYFIRVIPSLVVEELMSDLSITITTVTALISCFLITYTGLQAPAGIMLDRYGSRAILSSMMLLGALSTYIFASTDIMWLSYVSRLMFGLCASFSFVGAIKLATNWFPPSKLALLIGLTQTMGMLGAAISNQVMPDVIDLIGWRYTMQYLAIALGVLGILLGLFVRNKPGQCFRGRDKKTDKDSKTEKAKEVHDGAVMVVLKCKYTWLTAFFCGLIFAPTVILPESLGVEYLRNVYALPKLSASRAMGYIFLGWAVGGPLTGLLSNKLGRRAVMMYASLCCAALLSIILFVELKLAALSFACFSYGLANSGLVPAYTMAGELHPEKGTGLSISLSNMVTVLIGMALMPVAGLLLDFLWTGEFLNTGARHYTATVFKQAFMFLPILPILAFFCAYFSMETNKELLLKKK